MTIPTRTVPDIIHWKVHASCSLPPNVRTRPNALCSLKKVARPSVKKACENIGIQWKNACQLSVPKAIHDTSASTAVVAAAEANARHCEAAISASGNNRPYCGL